MVYFPPLQTKPSELLGLSFSALNIMPKIDLLLLHAPSVYDFREKSIMYGPVSDLIPSSPVFEMYPLGFLTITDYLESRGLKVRIVNLAFRMMNDRDFDVEKFLAKINPKACGIDLHWLPHAHGSLEIAKIMKRLHPEVPIIFGGLSSSYFHEELIRYPQVDFVVRGDSAEPPLYELLQRLESGHSLDDVPNLCWKDGNEVKINPFQFIPKELDYVDLKPERMIKMVLRHRDLASVIPFGGWWKNPITAVFTIKGCNQGCITCGASQEACGIINTRQHAVYRSPKSLIKNMQDIAKFSRGPIFLVGDLLQNGHEHAQEILTLLKESGLQNQIVFEFFRLPPAGFLKQIDSSVKNWSIELSPESHDINIRKIQDAKVYFTNEEMEEVIQEALSLNCHRIDVFFMIGLVKQSHQSVMDTIDYCEHLFQTSDQRLSCFISPMGPFIDPGSSGFENPERYGYTLFAKTLEEHRQLLVKHSWKHILNYETKWMTRDDLVRATYDAGEALNNLKLKYGRINKSRGEEVAARIVKARALNERLNGFEEENDLESEDFKKLRGEIREFSVSTVCDKTELFWKPKLMNYKPLGILNIAFSHFKNPKK